MKKREGDKERKVLERDPFSISTTFVYNVYKIGVSCKLYCTLPPPQNIKFKLNDTLIS